MSFWTHKLEKSKVFGKISKDPPHPKSGDKAYRCLVDNRSGGCVVKVVDVSVECTGPLYKIVRLNRNASFCVLKSQSRWQSLISDKLLLKHVQQMAKVWDLLDGHILLSHASIHSPLNTRTARQCINLCEPERWCL